MVLLSEITITSALLKLIVHFASLIIISIVLYFLIKFILNKISLKSKKYIYLICLWNLILGIIFPLLLITIIPNEKFTIFALLLIISTGYYGVFINIIISLLNHFLTNRRKKQG